MASALADTCSFAITYRPSITYRPPPTIRNPPGNVPFTVWHRWERVAGVAIERKMQSDCIETNSSARGFSGKVWRDLVPPQKEQLQHFQGPGREAELAKREDHT